MVTVILTHEVADYTTWRAGFDGDEANRQAVGVSILDVCTDTNNPNLVTVISNAPNADVITGMMANPDFLARIQSLGVKGKPEMKILNKM